MSVSERLFVEISDPSRRLSLERVSVNANGSFRFFSPPPDEDFEVRVVTEQNIVVEKVLVRASDPRPRVRIELRDWPGRKQCSDPDGGNAVSVYRLTHKVPKKARNEYENAVADYKKKKIEEAVEHLKKALEIDDGFVEALNGLGGRLLELQRPQEAEPYLRKAVDLDPSSPVPALNLTLAMVAQGKVVEAEALARKVLILDGGSERAQRVLNLCLQVQGKPTT